MTCVGFDLNRGGDLRSDPGRFVSFRAKICIKLVNRVTGEVLSCEHSQRPELEWVHSLISWPRDPENEHDIGEDEDDGDEGDDLDGGDSEGDDLDGGDGEGDGSHHECENSREFSFFRVVQKISTGTGTGKIW